MNLAKKIEKDRLDYVAEAFANYPKGRGVEVGVFKGEFSKSILERWDGTLYMVDVWRPLDWSDYNDMSNHSGHSDAYREAMESIVGNEDRAIMVRASSEIAASMFEDNSLDFVYIDANHAYDYVVQDIEVWYPKVRPGGLICGHDYIDIDWDQDPNFHENGKDKHIWTSVYNGVFGVNPAVDEFCRRNSLDLEVTCEWFGSWFATKPTSARIGVLVVYDDKYRDISGYTVGTNISHYCDLNGYKLYHRHVDPLVMGRYPAWGKVYEAKSILDSGEVDWLFVLDSDCLIMDHSVLLESFIDERYSMVLPSHCVPAVDNPMDRDVFGNDNVITSAFFVRNDDCGRRMISDIWDSVGLPDVSTDDFDYEGKRFRVTISRPEYSSRVNIVEESRLNSLWYQNSPFLVQAWPSINDNVWSDGKFIVHVTGYSVEERLVLLQKLNTFSSRLVQSLRRDGSRVYFCAKETIGDCVVRIAFSGNIYEYGFEAVVKSIVYYVDVPGLLEFDGNVIFEMYQNDMCVSKRIVPNEMVWL